MTELRLELDTPELSAGRDGVCHAIARISPPRRDRTRELPPLDLALAIDASGSMSGPPLEAAKEAVLRLARTLPDSTCMTLVSFDDCVVRHATLLPLDRRGRDEVRRRLRRLRAGAATDLHLGWQSACHGLETDSDSEERRRNVIVLSDGHANRGLVDPIELRRQAGERLERGITTSAVGIGADYSPPQLSALTETGGGQLHDAENGGEIVEVVLGEVNSFSEVVAEGLELVVDVPDGVRARELSGLPATFDGRRLVVPVGTLRSGGERSVVIRLEVPAALESPMCHGAVALTAHCEWRAPGSLDLRATPASGAAVRWVDGTPSRPSLVNARTVLTAWEAYIVRQVAAMNRDGQFDRIEQLFGRERLAFERYAAQYGETRLNSADLHRLRLRSSRPMEGRVLHAMRDKATKDSLQYHEYRRRKMRRYSDEF